MNNFIFNDLNLHKTFIIQISYDCQSSDFFKILTVRTLALQTCLCFMHNASGCHDYIDHLCSLHLTHYARPQLTK